MDCTIIMQTNRHIVGILCHHDAYSSVITNDMGGISFYIFFKTKQAVVVYHLVGLTENGFYPPLGSNMDVGIYLDDEW